ncbi:pyrroline-5-carboxylate reductase [Pseudodesulfovibrio thermohalotolerans]|uniref:pyrroline-5-carboxylate reductase n=1 Tax=Pseudodesulfovibrio thermohalotolerans TaxID=2880651 RepID=UPI0024435C94|nr:pyrroline-5-carboxylate reductase [Pseudodesulfovibrio thermohalotolerans]WFS60954.1 pyrroline-5-carboxylate reductase [Pseudodesulfovibrio thermohalotolerans]
MTKKIGFIGVGNMGSAIARGLASRDDIELHGVDFNKANLEKLNKELGLIVQENATDLAKACDYIVLAVKPQHAEPVVKELTPLLDMSKCLIAICAGIPLSTYEDWTEDRCPVVRIMPNTPALVGHGVSAVCLDNHNLTDENKALVPELFASVGQVHILPEKLFDAFTGVIGSGPAYVFYFMEALIESGVALGLTRAQSVDMVKGLFLGSAVMADKSEHSVSELREMVTSPGGTTVRALMHFDRQALRGDIIDGVFECYYRSMELGEK